MTKINQYIAFIFVACLFLHASFLHADEKKAVEICEHLFAVLERIEQPSVPESLLNSKGNLEALLRRLQPIMNKGRRGRVGPGALTLEEHRELAEAVAFRLYENGVASRLQFIQENLATHVPAHYRVFAGGLSNLKPTHFLARMPEKFRQKYFNNYDFGFDTIILLHSISERRVALLGRAGVDLFENFIALPLEDLTNSYLGPTGGHEVRHALRELGDRPQILLLGTSFRDGARAAAYYKDLLPIEETSDTYPYSIKRRIQQTQRLLRVMRQATDTAIKDNLSTQAIESFHALLWEMRIYIELWSSTYTNIVGFETVQNVDIKIYYVSDPVSHFNMYAQYSDAPPLVFSSLQIVRWFSAKFQTKAIFNRMHNASKNYLKAALKNERDEMVRQLEIIFPRFEQLLTEPELILP